MRKYFSAIILIIFLVTATCTAADAATAYYRSALTGGGTTALDSTDGARLNDGDLAFVAAGGVFYIYRLNATSGAAEESPLVIAPDSNAGDKRWILQNVYSAMAFENKTANYIFAGPASGGAAAPSFRGLVSADIPDLSSVYVTPSALTTALGGYVTSAALTTTLSGYQTVFGNQTANYVYAGPVSGGAAAPTFRGLVSGDIPDLSSSYVTPSALSTALGGYIQTSVIGTLTNGKWCSSNGTSVSCTENAPQAAFGNQSANQVYAGPASGEAAAPGFRGLVSGDIPDLSGSYVTPSALSTALGGYFQTSNVDTDGTMAANSDTKVPSQKAVVTYAAKKGSLTNGKYCTSDGTSINCTSTGAPLTANNGQYIYLDESGNASGRDIVERIGATFDGGGSAIALNKIAYAYIPFAGTVQKWTILCDQDVGASGIAITVYKDTYSADTLPTHNNAGYWNGSECHKRVTQNGTGGLGRECNHFSGWRYAEIPSYDRANKCNVVHNQFGCEEIGGMI